MIFPKEGEGPRGGEDRYTIAYFCHPEDAAELIEVPSEIVRQRGQKFDRVQNGHGKTLTARDHLNNRLAATYGIS